MGLAASQSRLLTITSRKASCEFQEMTLSHQKTALSRDMEAISSEYQNSLNLTKLIYSYQGTGSSKMDLTYGLLMNPSVYNDYNPKLVTDSKNRVILSSQYAKVARAAGIPAEGLSGTPSSDIRNKFVRALVSEGVITSTTGASVESRTYDNALGLGKTNSTQVPVINEVDLDGLIERIYNNCSDTVTWANQQGIVPIGAESFFSVNGANNQRYDGDKLIGNDKVENQTVEFHIKFNEVNLDTGTVTPGISLADLLKDGSNYKFTVDTCLKNERAPLFELAQMQNSLVEFVKWMDEQFTTVLGNAGINNEALNYAFNQVQDLIMPDNNIQDAVNRVTAIIESKEKDTGKWAGIVLDTHYQMAAGYLDSAATKIPYGTQPEGWGSHQYLGMVYTYTGGDKLTPWEETKNGTTGPCSSEYDNKNITVGCSLTNLAKAYLSSVIQYLQEDAGQESNLKWSLGKLSDTGTKFYDSDTDAKNIKIPVYDGMEDDDDNVNARYFDMLFNIICTQGWVQNNQIDNKDYLSEILKNGQAFISSLSNDGFYYQSKVSNDNLIVSVADDAAIAQAEAKYNTQKTRLQSKEQSIDLKMKNLETEVSSLNQEYETVKNLVSKAVEKSFKRYEA